MKQHLLRPARFAVLSMAFVSLFAACKKDDSTTTTPSDPNAVPEEVPVVRDGASFTQTVYKMVGVTTGANGLKGGIGVYDFSVDPKNQMHLLYYTGFQSQQDYLTNDGLSTFDLGSRKELPLTNTTWNQEVKQQDFFRLVYEFLPYTGNVVAFNATKDPNGKRGFAYWGGYIPRTDMPTTYVRGDYSGGAGYYNVYSECGPQDRYLTVDQVPDLATPHIHLNLKYESPAGAQFPEPRYLAQGKSVVISVLVDSVTAYRLDGYTSAEAIKTGTLNQKGPLYSQYNEGKLLRHYNADGTKMGMLVYDGDLQKYWTYTYNFTTQTLAAGLQSVDLPYSGKGSDIDLDEEGNIYYTGVSGNGGGAGVSVYKRSVGGTTLVGTDDFLKFGEVVKLHYLKGKVYMAVTGNVTGKPTWGQICVVAQK